MKIEYDDERFFHQYAQMSRSREGLSGRELGLCDLKSDTALCRRPGGCVPEGILYPERRGHIFV